MKTRIIDPRTEVEKEVVISADDGIRPTISPEKLGKLPAVFKQGGSTTAGNASQVGVVVVILSLCRMGAYMTSYGICRFLMVLVQCF